MMTNKLWRSAWIVAAATMATAPVTVLAQTAAPTPTAPTPAAPAATTEATPAPAAEAAPPPGLWIDGIHLSAQLEAGISFNPAGPKTNYGQLFTDHPNQPLLNQLLLTANKPLDPKDADFQWGFKLQGMFGSDARYTQFLGELNRVDPYQRDQFDIVEANVLFHLPVLSDGGVDIKAGQYPTPLGFETIDPSTNPFYTHSYIFNFGLPFKHTGLLATAHLTPLLDIYAGVDTGVNTTWGRLGDDNSAVAFLGGFGLNMMDGNLTVLALSHIGPENASRVLSTLPPSGFNADGYMRYLNDVIVTYKASDTLTFVTEANWIRDDFAGYYSSTTGTPSAANAFGAAQYVSYTMSDTITLNGRVEIYRDDNNFFVASFPTNNDFVGAEQGIASGTAAPHATTYSEITLGVTWKSADMPAPVTGLLIRPEVRYDRALTNTHPYNGGKDDGSFTLASDFVLTF